MSYSLNFTSCDRRVVIHKAIRVSCPLEAMLRAGDIKQSFKRLGLIGRYSLLDRKGSVVSAAEQHLN